MDNISTMSKKYNIELTRAILDQLSISDIEAILEEKKNALKVDKHKTKPLSKWKRYELYIDTELKKRLYPPKKQT